MKTHTLSIAVGDECSNAFRVFVRAANDQAAFAGIDKMTRINEFFSLTDRYPLPQKFLNKLNALADEGLLRRSQSGVFRGILHD